MQGFYTACFISYNLMDVLRIIWLRMRRTVCPKETIYTRF